MSKLKEYCTLAVLQVFMDHISYLTIVVSLNISLVEGLEDNKGSASGSRERLAVSCKSTFYKRKKLEDYLTVSAGKTGLVSTNGDCFFKEGNCGFIRQSSFNSSNAHVIPDSLEQAITCLSGKEDSTESKSSTFATIIMISQ